MIGIFGGSFDPVHLGHLKTAKSIKKELNFESLFLLPCHDPVHKNSLHYSPKQRLEMLNLAIKDYPSLEIDTREIDREGNSYMIDTLADLTEEFKGKTICLIIGMDSFLSFKTWKKWDEFARLVHLIILPRNTDRLAENNLETFDLALDKSDLNISSSGLLYFSNSELIDISSTDIRGKIASNQNLDGLMPSPVIKFLQKI
ncbi:nicotinate (nicotinamide) nucleotide adenylyltransferase [Candidatus Thioglobus sp.]|nr:nicotinate (nicotinamide) nucleotide adenylyltransferase [Candidatus Thioglobus sp.]